MSYTPYKKHPFTLYWSSLAMFESCPQKFLWSKGWGSIDIGEGPGRRKKRPLQDSKHHAVMGIVLADVMEDFYNLELWKHPQGLRERLEEITRKKFLLCLARNHVDWRLAPSREEMLTVCSDGILNYVGKTLKAHMLLGPYAKSEVDMVAYINKYTPIGGRADLIFRREDTGTTILDGKNSKEHWDRKKSEPMFYTDPDQLKWYGLCYYLAYRQMPDRLGFIYYRYPTGYTWEDETAKYRKEAVEQKTGKWKDAVADFYEDREPATGVKWIDFTRDDLKDLAQRGVAARKSMDKEQFEARPSPSTCRFCDFQTICNPRIEQKAANSGKRRGKKADPLLDGSSGIIQFGMGSSGSVSLDSE